ncbi:MAG: peptidylprolyl isomerase, partial [Kiritimatiellia bacterium]
RHILIATEAEESDEAKAEKRQQAEQIRDQLKEGADFAKLAEEHSACPSKASGGDLGEFQRGQMVPAFEDVAFELEIDEFSDVVETQYGYHIIQAVGHTQPRTIEIDEARGRIMEALKGQMVQERAEMLLDNLRRDTTVTYNVEEFDPQAAEIPMLPILPAAE